MVTAHAEEGIYPPAESSPRSLALPDHSVRENETMALAMKTVPETRFVTAMSYRRSLHHLLVGGKFHDFAAVR